MRGIAKFSTWMASAAAFALVPGAAYALEAGEAAGGEAVAAPSDQIVVEGKQSKERFPTSIFVKAPNLEQPRISTDGSKMAYMMNDKGAPILVYLDLNTPNAKPKVIMAGEEAKDSGDRTVGQFRWVGKDLLVITIAMFEDLGGGPGNFTRLVSYDTNTGKLTQLAWDGSGGGAANILHTDYEKQKLLVERDVVGTSNERSGRPQVISVDARTGKYNIVQNINPLVSAWAADGQGVVRYGSSYDGDTGKIRLLYRSNPKEALQTVSNEKREFTDGFPAPQLFIPGTDMAYAISRKDGYDKVYKINVKTMELGAPVFETKGFDVQSLLLNKRQTDIDGYVSFNGEMKAVYTNPLMQEIRAAGEELFGKNMVSIADVSLDESKAVLAVGRTTNHTAYYLFDLKTGKTTLINYGSVILKDTPQNPVRAEWYTASDGMKLQAIVTYPRHRMGVKKLPVVIMPHGGPFGVISATNQNEPWSQPLAEAGYVVIQPNYRGSGGYGKQYEEEGRKKNGYGVRMQDDKNDLLKFYGDKGIIDPNRACIMGWSYGGYAAARGAQRDGNLWKCAIAGAGVYDFPLMTAWDKKNLGKFSSGFQATSDDPKGISSAHNTDGKWAPILIVAAMRDRRIPLEQSRTLVSRLKASGKKEGVDFRYIEQPKGTHNLPYDDVHVQWIEEAEAWLAKYNPAYIATDADKPMPVMAIGTPAAAKSGASK
jgi:dipeptidyl aminopeptidase/acylaminoacyl peptidase